MIVWQMGMLNWVFSVIIMVAVILGLCYFVAFPTIAFIKLTRTWKTRDKIILFITYFGLFFTLATLLFNGFIYDARLSFQIFWLAFIPLPLVTIGIIAFFKTCLNSTRDVESPFANAVRT